MKKNLYLLFLAFFVFGFANNAGAQISGGTHVCVGSTITLTDSGCTGSWASSNTSVATVTGSVVVTGVAAGTAVIRHIGCSDSAIVTVLARPADIVATSASICVGALDTVTDATTGGTWSLSSTSIATIASGSAGAVVRGLSDGIDTIRYTNTSGCSATRLVTVRGPVAVTPHNPTICAGTTLTLTDAVTGGSWFSGSTSVATIGTTGIVTGVASGEAIISYIQGSCIVRDTVGVLPGAGLIGPSSPITLCIGGTATLTDATSGGSWSSTFTSIATVTSAGHVFGASNGTDTIKYTVTSGCSATKLVTVASPSALSPVNPGICIGGTVTLTDGVTGGSWGSTNTSVATITSGGVVSGASVGTAIIS